MPWHTIQSQKKHEHLAAAQLSAIDGVEIFCPRIRFERLSRHSNKGKVRVTEALFPGYLFARFDYENLHRAVRYAPGVAKIVHFGDQIPLLPDEAIEELRHMASEEQELIPVIEIGTDVQLAGGVWTGFEAVVTGFVEAKQRVKVLIDLLGRLIETEVPFEQVLLPTQHPMQKS